MPRLCTKCNIKPIQDRNKSGFCTKCYACLKAKVNNKRRYQELPVLRETVFRAYGRFCACCGETQRAFLTLDHVNGGGERDRKRYTPDNLLRKIIRLGFPPEYQILCMNCNFAKGQNGQCPHKTREALIEAYTVEE